MRVIAAVAARYCKSSFARQYRLMLDVAFAIIGFGMTIAGLVMPLRYPKISKALLDAGMILGSALFGAGIALIFVSLQESTQAPAQSVQRHLKSDEKFCLMQSLDSFEKKHPVLGFYYVNDPEAESYAFDWYKLFKNLNFTLPGGFASATSFDSGIVLGVQNPNDIPKDAQVFYNTLEACGLNVTIETSDSAQSNDGDFDFFISDPSPSN